MTPLMKTSPRGISLIKRYEGLALKAYQDIAGYWTIGYGHKGPPAEPGAVFTLDEADQTLSDDLEKFERCVLRNVTAPINQNQFDAFVAIAFNIGCQALRESTFLRRFNDGNTPEHVAAAILWWNKVNGRTIARQVERRRAEADLFLEPA